MAPARPGRRPARRRRPGRARAAGPATRRSTRDRSRPARRAVVTGGSRGHRPGDRAAARDARAPTSRSATAATRRRPTETAAAIEALGRRALAIQGDVTDPEAADALVKAALEAFGKVDILVNNAGITRDDLIMRMSDRGLARRPRDEPVRRVLRDQGRHPADAQGPGGRIINITSVSGQAGQMGQANYSSAKAGLIGLTKATARELASRGHHGQRRRARASCSPS